MKRINIIKIIIIVLMSLCIITSITYAYFSELIQTNDQISSNVHMPNGTYSFVVAYDENDNDTMDNSNYRFSLKIGQKNMTMSSSNTEPVATNSTSILVYLESNSDDLIVCTYDLLIQYYFRDGSFVELPITVNGTTYNHEFSIVGNQTSTGIPSVLEMEDIPLQEIEMNDLKPANRAREAAFRSVLYSNAVIANSNKGTIAKTKWDLTLNYYNLPVVQDRYVISDSFGYIYLMNVNCQNFNPRIVYENGMVDSIGTEVELGNERFYIIGSNETDVTLLSKYNLKVGVKDTNNVSNLYTSSDKAYNMQCRDCLGYVSDINAVKSGTIAYSNTSNVNYNNSLVKTYIDNYVNNIKTYYNIDIKSSRLMTLDELTNLGCISNSNCNVTTVNDLSREWLYSSSYWVDGYSGSNVYTVKSDGIISTNSYSTNDVAGIRPVIVVSKADFEVL